MEDAAELDEVQRWIAREMQILIRTPAKRTTNAHLQVVHRRQGAVDRLRHQPLGHSPAEHADDPADPAVDCRPGQAGGHHLLTDCLQLQRTEVHDPAIAVQATQRAEGVPVVRLLPGGSAVRVAVVGLDMLPER